MVVPFLRTAITGVAFYQGEADCQGEYPHGTHESSVAYACTFPALVASWRARCHAASRGATDAVFPFGFVQLSTWGDAANGTCGDRRTAADSRSCDVGVVRWGQTGNVGFVPNGRLPRTFMAVAVDLGDPSSPFGDIHPRYKQQVGARLALAARGVAYPGTGAGAGVAWNATTGPLAANASAAAAPSPRVVVTFRNTGTAPLRVKHGMGFETSVAPCNWSFPAVEPDGTWQDATVLATGDASVTLAGTARCVRYNWYNAACSPAAGPFGCAVYGQAALGMWLPAPPFITAVV